MQVNTCSITISIVMLCVQVSWLQMFQNKTNKRWQIKKYWPNEDAYTTPTKRVRGGMPKPTYAAIVDKVGNLCCSWIPEERMPDEVLLHCADGGTVSSVKLRKNVSSSRLKVKVPASAHPATADRRTRSLNWITRSGTCALQRLIFVKYILW